MITLDLNHFGFQRAGRPEKRKKSREDRTEERRSYPMVVRWVGRRKARANLSGGELVFEYVAGTHKGNHRRGGSKPGPTLMVVSWTWSICQAPTRVIIRGGRFQSRANLNGGELDTEPFLRCKGNEITRHRCKGGTKVNAHLPDRPKWRRAGAGMPKMQDKEKIGRGRKLKTHPRTNLNGGDLVRSTFPVLTLRFTLAFVATLALTLILAFGAERP